MHGAADGMTHRYTLYSGNNQPRTIRTKETGLVIRQGARLVLESGGGGGWGDPKKRDANDRARDIESGFATSPHTNPPPLAGEGVRNAGAGASKPLSRTAGEGGARAEGVGG